MAAKSQIQHWNYLREHSILRGAISFKIEESKRSIVDISKELNIHPHKLRKYLRAETPSLNNYELLKLCNILGMDIELEIKPLSTFTPF